jgi:hypothetical protein
MVLEVHIALDMLELNWHHVVATKQVYPETTVVFLDDDLHVFKRISNCILKSGVRHVNVEDNYKPLGGATQKDKVSTPEQAFSGKMPPLVKEGNWLFSESCVLCRVSQEMEMGNEEGRRLYGGL